MFHLNGLYKARKGEEEEGGAREGERDREERGKEREREREGGRERKRERGREGGRERHVWCFWRESETMPLH